MLAISAVAADSLCLVCYRRGEKRVLHGTASLGTIVPCTFFQSRSSRRVHNGVAETTTGNASHTTAAAAAAAAAAVVVVLISVTEVCVITDSIA